MPSIFSRLKGKDGPTKISKSKKNGNLDHLTNQLPQKPQWEDGFARTTVEPEEVQELVHRCTSELKARGEGIMTRYPVCVRHGKLTASFVLPVSRP